MMKKKTVRLISCIIAGILVAAMVFSMIASGLVYAGAVSSKELKSKLSDLEDQKTSVKAELDSLAGKVDEVAKTRAALQKEIKLTKEEITTEPRISTACRTRSTSRRPSWMLRSRRWTARRSVFLRLSARRMSRVRPAIWRFC